MKALMMTVVNQDILDVERVKRISEEIMKDPEGSLLIGLNKVLIKSINEQICEMRSNRGDRKPEYSFPCEDIIR